MKQKRQRYPFSEVERFHKRSAQAGLSEDDIWDLVAEGIEVSHLMEHVETVLTNRMN